MTLKVPRDPNAGGLFRKKVSVMIRARRVSIPTTIIHPLHGELMARAGDWIITGRPGDVYPCADAVFRELYEPVDDQARANLAGPVDIGSGDGEIVLDPDG